MTRWLMAVVVLMPLALLPASWGVSLPESKTLAFILLGAGTVLLLIRNLWLRAFAAWTVLAYLLAGAYAFALTAVAGVLAWAVLHQQARSLPESFWPKVRVAVLVSALGQVAWLGVQLAGVDPIFTAAPTQAGTQPTVVPTVGWFGNPMDLALYLGLALPLLVAVRPAWLGLAAAGVTAGAILLLLRATVGAMAVGVTAVWLLWAWVPSWPGRVGVLLGVGLLGGLYVAAVDPQVGARPLIWRQTAQVIALRPFSGYGPNALDHRVIVMTPASALRWNFVFNEWLQAWLELGVLAPMLAAGYLVSLLRRLRGRAFAAAELTPALAILLLASLFSIPMRIAPVALLAALVLGQLDRRLA